jgi:hypothetical protein
VQTHQFFVASAVAALLAGTIVGILRARLYRVCWAFLFYLVAVLVGNVLVSYWPERFYNYPFWIFKEQVYALSRVAIAVEIAAKVFTPFPRARRRVAVALGIVAVFTAIAIASSAVAMHSTTAGTYWRVLGFLQPRGQAGTIWMFLVVVVAAAWYRTPLHYLHRAILGGFVLYLAATAWAQSVVGAAGWSAYAYLAALDPAMYAGCVSVWAYAVWHRQPDGNLSPEVARRLMPWAVSC